jgi:hypothetical protein
MTSCCLDRRPLPRPRLFGPTSVPWPIGRLAPARPVLGEPQIASWHASWHLNCRVRTPIAEKPPDLTACDRGPALGNRSQPVADRGLKVSQRLGMLWPTQVPVPIGLRRRRLPGRENPKEAIRVESKSCGHLGVVRAVSRLGEERWRRTEVPEGGVGIRVARLGPDVVELDLATFGETRGPQEGLRWSRVVVEQHTPPVAERAELAAASHAPNDREERRRLRLCNRVRV